MANPAAFPNRPFNLRTVTWTVSQDIPNNRSLIRTQVFIDKTGYSPTFSGDGEGSRSIRWAGTTKDSATGYGFDFTGSGPWLALDYQGYITHDPDGTLTFQVRADASYAILGATITTMNYTPATIPRASTASFVGGSSLTTGTPVTINTNRASSTFTHDITWHFSGDTGSIGTGVGASDSWTPNASMFDSSGMYDKTSGSGYIRVVTKNGSTVIGTKDTTFTLTLANNSTGQPTWSSVTAEEAITSPDIATLVGKYVQNVSKVKGTITGAAGIQGSTVTSKKFTVAGQTVNVSGTTATTPSAISATGSQNVAFEVTDTRGRKKTQNVAIDILPYTTPKATGISVYRAAATGTTPDPQGTRLAVDLTATVQSLMNSTQRNRLTVKVYTSPADANTWTLRGTPVNASTTLSQNVVAGFGAVGDYPVEDSFDVKIEVEDVFAGTTRASYIGTIPTGGIFQHWSTGMGLGKFWEEGMLDVMGDIHVKAGNGMDGDILVAGDADIEGIAYSNRVRAEATGGVSLSSTTHAFQTGTSGAANLVADTDEIQARNNGAAATLNLNVRGGDVNIGASSDADVVNIRGHMSNDYLPWAMAAGRVSTVNATGTTTVTFPAGRFSSAPRVFSAGGEQGNVGVPRIVNVTTTSFSLNMWNLAGTQVGGTDVDWIAVQMTSGSGSG